MSFWDDTWDDTQKVFDDWWNELSNEIGREIYETAESVLPEKAKEWLKDKVIIPSATQIVKEKIRGNAIWIGLSLSVIALVFMVTRRK